ncbi:MAG: LPS export ABC transporter periplasmic protein LptC [Bacteroidota bacterium]
MKTLTQVFFIFFIFIASGCEEKIKPSVANITSGKIPTQESWNSDITFSDSGRVRAKLHAGYIAVFSDEQYTVLDSGMRAHFYDEHGYHTSKMTSRRGKVNDVTQDLEASGNVVIISDSGTTVKTETVFWDNAKQKIHSAAFVEITSPREVLRGYGFESDQSLKNYKVFRVTGSARVEEQQ